MEYTKEYKIMVKQREVNYLKNEIENGRQLPVFKDIITKLENEIEVLKCVKQ
jgi:hypothetical protein